MQKKRKGVSGFFKNQIRIEEITITTRKVLKIKKIKLKKNGRKISI
jgi:hypothetical protein